MSIHSFSFFYNTNQRPHISHWTPSETVCSYTWWAARLALDDSTFPQRSHIIDSSFIWTSRICILRHFLSTNVLHSGHCALGWAFWTWSSSCSTDLKLSTQHFCWHLYWYTSWTVFVCRKSSEANRNRWPQMVHLELWKMKKKIFMYWWILTLERFANRHQLTVC